MFPKAVLIFLGVGTFSVNALSVPVPRSPAPEPQSQELEARSFPELAAHDLLSREPQALGELFSREPEDRAEWAGSARDYYMAKREPFETFPGGLEPWLPTIPENKELKVPKRRNPSLIRVF